MQSENDDVYKSQMNFFSKDIVSAVIACIAVIIEPSETFSLFRTQRELSARNKKNVSLGSIFTPVMQASAVVVF